jgi:hypothetical protein
MEGLVECCLCLYSGLKEAFEYTEAILLML